MKRNYTPICVLAAMLCAALCIRTALADVLISGGVSPTDPTSWSNVTTGLVGTGGDGSLTVNGGSVIMSQNGYIGNESGVSGVVTIDGAGSRWRGVVVAPKIYVGNSGSGTLNVFNGGAVDISGYIGYSAGANGTVNVHGANSRLTSNSTILPTYVGYGGRGTLNVTGGASVVAAGSSGIRAGNLAGSVGTINVFGAGSTINGSCTVANNSTITISDGAKVINTYVNIGGITGANAVGIIDGRGSAWNSVYRFNIGSWSYPAASSTMRITNGGTVSADESYIENAIVTIDGANSSWTTMSRITGGSSYKLTMSISGGGKFASPYGLSIPSGSFLEIDVGCGSSLDAGSGFIINNGRIRVVASAGVPELATYSPISASVWSGWPTAFQALGGTWNDTTHRFVTSELQAGTAGVSNSLNLSSKQRLLVTDSQTSSSVGASFLSKTGSSTALNFTATAMSDTELGKLVPLLPAAQQVDSAWNFTISGSGYTSGDPVYVSFDVGPGLNRNWLNVWHYDGTTWSPFVANDLTYDGRYASFAVTSFGGYAIAVPEPGAMTLLFVALGTVAATNWIRKRQKLRGA